MSIRLQNTPTYSCEYYDFVDEQRFAIIDTFTLESDVTLHNVNVGYKTWGKLNAEGSNCLVICHALSGSSDVEDWWGPLLGDEKAFDTSRYFVFCGNVLGSPYGSTSPLSINPATGNPYGPDFPQTTIRDDVRLHKLILDTLGVKSVVSVIGGSMGGMATLEWPLCTLKGYIKSIIPIATSADHSAWGIAWAETQRQCIAADSRFKNGYYMPTPATQPIAGLSAARMIAMLTYRSELSFDRRFSRRNMQSPIPGKPSPRHLPSPPPELESLATESRMTFSPSSSFSVQSYLNYQGQKFIRRFDANCYIHITHKMDRHDVLRGRDEMQSGDTEEDYLTKLQTVFSIVPPHSLVIGVESDILFSHRQQRVLADTLPDAQLVMIDSAEGHDGFLLAFSSLDHLITQHLKKHLSWVYDCPAIPSQSDVKTVKDSVFGEVESSW